MQAIQNIIFDLGGVFINLDFNKTDQAFSQLGINRFQTMFSQSFSNTLFEALETGKISEEVFYTGFREQTQSQLTDDQIQDAWNAMLLDFPPERIQWLAKIRSKYNIYLFSNTNIIHYQEFIKIFEQNYPHIDWNGHFIKAYYSHEMGMRKPDVDAFRYIIDAHQLEASQTLFIDDTAPNIVAAQAAGLQTIHLTGGLTVLDLPL